MATSARPSTPACTETGWRENHARARSPAVQDILRVSLPASLGDAITWVGRMRPNDVVSAYASVPASVAPFAQAAVTTLGLAATVWMFARPHPHDLRVAIVPIAMSLTSPYMHFYDLVALGIPTLVIGKRLEAAGQPILPYATLVGAVLCLCLFASARIHVQPHPLFACLAACGVVWLGSRHGRRSLRDPR